MLSRWEHGEWNSDLFKRGTVFCVSKPKSSVLHRHDFFFPDIATSQDIQLVLSLAEDPIWHLPQRRTLWFNFKITHSVHKSRPQLIPSASFPWVQKQRSKAETCSAKSSGEGEEGSLFEDQSSSRGEHKNVYSIYWGIWGCLEILLLNYLSKEWACHFCFSKIVLLFSCGASVKALVMKFLLSRYPYCWWKKSCTICYLWNYMKNGIFTIFTGGRISSINSMNSHKPTSIFQRVLFDSKGWWIDTPYHPFSTPWKVQEGFHENGKRFVFRFAAVETNGKSCQLWMWTQKWRDNNGCK